MTPPILQTPTADRDELLRLLRLANLFWLAKHAVAVRL